MAVRVSMTRPQSGFRSERSRTQDKQAMNMNPSVQILGARLIVVAATRVGTSTHARTQFLARLRWMILYSHCCPSMRQLEYHLWVKKRFSKRNQEEVGRARHPSPGLRQLATRTSVCATGDVGIKRELDISRDEGGILMRNLRSESVFRSASRLPHQDVRVVLSGVPFPPYFGALSF